MVKPKMTAEEKSFDTLTKTMMTMYGQAVKNKRQVLRMKVAYGFLGELIKEIEKKYDEKNKLEKTESDPFDPYKRKYYASKGFYQQLRAADMMGYKSEGTLVKYRKNGVLKEGIHWIRTVGRGISYNPEKCKETIREAKEKNG